MVDGKPPSPEFAKRSPLDEADIEDIIVLMESLIGHYKDSESLLTDFDKKAAEDLTDIFMKME